MEKLRNRLKEIREQGKLGLVSITSGVSQQRLIKFIEGGELTEVERLKLNAVK